MKGKIDYEWIRAVREWKEAHPPDFNGYWYCRIGGGALTDGRQDNLGGFQFNLCHDDSRVRKPGSKYDTSKCFPGCPRHNREQGSRTLKQYLATNPSRRCGNM